MNQYSLNKDYIDVKCVKEIPGRPLFSIGSTYSSNEINRGQGRTIWVGIPGQGGHDFNNEDFDFYFQKVF